MGDQKSDGIPCSNTFVQKTSLPEYKTGQYNVHFLPGNCLFAALPAVPSVSSRSLCQNVSLQAPWMDAARRNMRIKMRRMKTRNNWWKMKPLCRWIWLGKMRTGANIQASLLRLKETLFQWSCGSTEFGTLMKDNSVTTSVKCRACFMKFGRSNSSEPGSPGVNGSDGHQGNSTALLISSANKALLSTWTKKTWLSSPLLRRWISWTRISTARTRMEKSESALWSSTQVAMTPTDGKSWQPMQLVQKATLQWILNVWQHGVLLKQFTPSLQKQPCRLTYFRSQRLQATIFTHKGPLYSFLAHCWPVFEDIVPSPQRICTVGLPFLFGHVTRQGHLKESVKSNISAELLWILYF